MKLDRRILSPLFIGVDIDLRYFITVYCCRYMYVFIIVTFFLWNTIYTCGMQTKRCSFFILCSFKFREKKLTPALFVNDFCSPKVTTPLKLRPPKAGNSESNEGRYYRNSTVSVQRWVCNWHHWCAFPRFVRGTLSLCRRLFLKASPSSHTKMRFRSNADCLQLLKGYLLELEHCF